MMRIYKYIPKQYLDSFKKNGQINIGTIEYYRNIESEQRKDTTEGRFIYRFHSKNKPILLSNAEANSITNDYRIGNDTKIQIMPNTYFESDLKVPNVFVFCASIMNTSDLKLKFGDICYEIINIQTFGEIIFNKLNEIQRIKSWIARPVEYIDSKIVYVNAENKSKVLPKKKLKLSDKHGIRIIHINDYYIKSKEFSPESEFRYIFIPENEPTFINKTIQVPDILRYIKFDE